MKQVLISSQPVFVGNSTIPARRSSAMRYSLLANGQPMSSTKQMASTKVSSRAILDGYQGARSHERNIWHALRNPIVSILSVSFVSPSPSRRNRPLQGSLESRTTFNPARSILVIRHFYKSIFPKPSVFIFLLYCRASTCFIDFPI